MKKNLSLFLLLFLVSGCATKKVGVKFFFEENAISLRDNFSVSIVIDSDTVRCKVNKGGVEIPKAYVNKETPAAIVFETDNQAFTINIPDARSLYPDQDMVWIFGVDQRPFNPVIGALSMEEIQADSITKEVFYLKLDPQESGDGLMFISKQ
ncbi:MAG TPA: hypothetical protein VIM75_09925 [Ohtaekwangia sp.]|uniref:hypothetical protein n=1 Tax=Ohtaekwangia sp. TaxID=2066019 RepID=UPI002F935C23